MKFKSYILCILIVLSRLLDLYTTHIATQEDFGIREQNFLVKVCGFSKNTFFISEVLFALLLAIIYLKAVKRTEYFRVKSNSFNSYLERVFFKKNFNNRFYLNWSFSFKNVFYLFGLIIPELYITTSIILSINNYWVYLFYTNNERAIELYKIFDRIHLIDFFIFYFPILLLVLYAYIRLRKFYLSANETTQTKR